MHKCCHRRTVGLSLVQHCDCIADASQCHALGSLGCGAQGRTDSPRISFRVFGRIMLLQVLLAHAMFPEGMCSAELLTCGWLNREKL